MSSRVKKIAFTTAACAGLFAGAAAIASAATGNGSSGSGDTAVNSSVTLPTTKYASDAEEAKALAEAAKIGFDKAAEAARAAVSGTVTEVELDNKHGSVVYEVEVVTDTGDVEVIVDAGNGNVLAQHRDDEDDDHDGGRDDSEKDDKNGANEQNEPNEQQAPAASTTTP